MTLWAVPQFSTLYGKYVSDTVLVGDHTWDIVMYTQGTDNSGKALSVFLNVPDCEKLPSGWARRQAFRLIAIDQLDLSKSVVKESTHTFTANEVDWGFKEFLPLKDVLDPARGFLVDDILKVRAEFVMEEVKKKKDPEKVEEPEGVYTWSIPRFSTLKGGKLFSDAFVAGGSTWNILLFPKGTKGGGEALSIFLNVPGYEELPSEWAWQQSFKLTVIDQQTPAKSIVKDSTHTFSAKEIDWGFTAFVPLEELQDPAKGFLVDDTLKVRAELEMTAVEDVKKEDDDLDDKKDAGGFTWAVPQFSTLDGKIYSNTFVAGGHTWDILLFPKGSDGKGKALSIFLNVPGHDKLPVGWSRKHYFKLMLIDQPDASYSVVKDSSHTFCAKEIDWGFTNFLPLEELRDPARGFLVDDTLKIMCNVSED